MTTFDPSELSAQGTARPSIPATRWRDIAAAGDWTGRLAFAAAVAVGLAVPLVWVAAQFYAPEEDEWAAYEDDNNER